jgi:hypothetical protein
MARLVGMRKSRRYFCVGPVLLLALGALTGCSDTSSRSVQPAAEEDAASTQLALPCRIVDAMDILHETAPLGEPTPQAAIEHFVQDEARYLSSGEPEQRLAGDWVWVASDDQVEAVFRLREQSTTYVVDGFDKCAGFVGRP